VRSLSAIAVIASSILCISCAGAGPHTPQAKPYKVTGSVEMAPSNGRTARHWYIVSESSTFEEHAQTLVAAARDLHREHGLDLTQVTLYPSEALAGSGFRLAHAFYAADGRAGQGLPGADPDYRATWSVLATRDEPSPTELRVAELWVALAPEYPSQDLWSSCLVDEAALRTRISEELGLREESIQLPHLTLERWIESAE
jgi:hypothetical protein